jgi:hypothetical protein
MSREHLISKSQFDTDTITLVGLPWCQQPKTVGLASLVAKNLCRDHNMALSPVDLEAARFKRALSVLFSSDRVLPVRVRLAARLVERWLLKTTINLALQGEEPAIDVTDALVQVAFGLSSPPDGQGFFFIANEGTTLAYESGVTLETFIRKQTGRVAMAVFGFHGCQAVYAFHGAAPIRGAFRLTAWNGDDRWRIGGAGPLPVARWMDGADWIRLRWIPPLARDDRAMPKMQQL